MWHSFSLFIWEYPIRFYEVLKGRVHCTVHVRQTLPIFSAAYGGPINHPEFFRIVCLPGISISKNGCLRSLLNKFCFRNSYFLKNKCLNSLKSQTKKPKFCKGVRSTFLGHIPKIINFENVEKNFNSACLMNFLRLSLSKSHISLICIDK